MLLTEDKADGRYQIQSYKPGQLVVSKEIYTDSIIVGKNDLISPWRPNSVAEITPEDIQPILDLKPDIILLGTGEQFILPEPWQLEPIYQHKLGIECMTTAAACRTLIALLSEERNAVATLII